MVKLPFKKNIRVEESQYSHQTALRALVGKLKLRLDFCSTSHHALLKIGDA